MSRVLTPTPRERNINEVYIMYSHTFPHLSERFFKGSTWPAVESVLHLVDGDHVFGLLYKEMYYRHLYASTKPTIEQRVDSWDNYRELFSGARGRLRGGQWAAQQGAALACRAALLLLTSRFAP